MQNKKLSKASSSINTNSHTAEQNPKLAYRPFGSQVQKASVAPVAKTDIEDITFAEQSIEATGLELQAKYGKITPESQERLTVLQAKMDGLLNSRLEHATRFGHNFANIPLRRPDTPIQAKLTIGEPGDKYEQEADETARQVVQSIHQPQSDKLQRESLPDEEEELQMKPEGNIQRESLPEEEDELQRSPMVQRVSDGGMAASPDFETSINQARGGGQPLANNIRQPMEQAFGVDFSRVKVHTDSQADQLNQSIQAKAFTTGQDVFFRQGTYEPGSRGGQELLAHELTHVVQQNGGAVQRYFNVEPGSNIYPAKKEKKIIGKDKNADTDIGFFVSQEEREGSFYGKEKAGNITANLGYKSNAPLMISDQLDLAIEASGEAKYFFATKERIEEANEALKGGIKLKKTDKYLSMISDAGEKKLYQVKAYVPKDKKSTGKEGKGLDLKIPQACNDMADFVSGNFGLKSSASLQVYTLLASVLTEHTDENYTQRNKEAYDGLKTIEGLNAYKALIDEMSDQFRILNTPENKERLNATFKKLNVNQYLEPDIGMAVTTFGVYTSAEEANLDKEKTFLYHFGTAIAKSGSDYITMENYARRDDASKETLQGGDPLFFFKMYGNNQTEKNWHETQLATEGFVGTVLSFVVT
jgi:hypothetical protein